MVAPHGVTIRVISIRVVRAHQDDPRILVIEIILARILAVWTDDRIHAVGQTRSVIINIAIAGRRSLVIPDDELEGKGLPKRIAFRLPGAGIEVVFDELAPF
jgi:hypothetical protein